MPLSVIREGRAPTEPWLPSDRLLSVALTLHEQSIAGCGHYLDEAYGGRGDFSAESTVCSACAAIERHHAEHEKPAPGEKVIAVNNAGAPSDDEVLPVFG